MTIEFKVGNNVKYGKYKNKRGKIVSFDEDEKGNPTVKIQPNPKGKKKNVVIGLYKIWSDNDEEKNESIRLTMSQLRNLIKESLNDCYNGDR